MSNSNFEFINYEETPGEKNYLGIATIKYGIGQTSMVLRYKIVMTKDGKNRFPAQASYKMSDERYIPAFQLDSVSENESLTLFIKKKVAEYYDVHSVNSSLERIGSTNVKYSNSQSNQERKSIAEPFDDGKDLPF